MPISTKTKFSFLFIVSVIFNEETAFSQVKLNQTKQNVIQSETSNSTFRSQGLEVDHLNNLKTVNSETVPTYQYSQYIEIPVPPPRTQRIKVQPVAELPQVTAISSVPSVANLPIVVPKIVDAKSPSIPLMNNSVPKDSSWELSYPLTIPVSVTSRFGWRTHPLTGNRRFHSGADLGAPLGAPVVAAADGEVVAAGWLGGYGNTIIIQHRNFRQTLYAHLSEIMVQPGQNITRGSVIGLVGSTGRSTGPHLHFESRLSTVDGWTAVDPSQDLQYALDRRRRSMSVAQKDY
jgi:murein DD-endopeptidase MepM/ murein hydrolase activator NlpD